MAAKAKKGKRGLSDTLAVNVALTGVNAMESPVCIVGIAGDTKNVRLLVQGVIPALGSLLDDIHAQRQEDHAVQMIAKAHRIPIAAASLQLSWAKDNSHREANHKPIGSDAGLCDLKYDRDGAIVTGTSPTARFCILDPGVWMEYASKHDRAHILEEFCDKQRWVTWQDILSTMNTNGAAGVGINKEMVLRAKLFAVTDGPKIVRKEDAAADAREVIDIPALLGFQSMCTVYDMNECLVALPDPDGRGKVTLQEVCDKFDVREGTLEEMVATFTEGELRSMMQKIARFRAAEVYGDRDTGSVRMRASVAAELAIWLLCAKPARLDPQLQEVVRGDTAAMKRTVVTCLEDAWVPRCEGKLLAFVLLAEATKTIPSYMLPRACIGACAEFLALMTASGALLGWRPYPCELPFETVCPTLADTTSMQLVASHLKSIGSFKTDIQMAERIAAMYASGSVCVYRAVDETYEMPLTHIVDQHRWRGIGHVQHDGPGSFEARFRDMFYNCTDANPRRIRIPSIEAFERQVSAARSVQRIAFACGRFIRADGREPIATVTITATIPERALAMAVGPIMVGSLCVILGMGANPEEMTVFRPPSKKSKTASITAGITDAQRDKAIRTACGRGERSVTSDDLPPGPHRVKFDNGTWLIDGMRWNDFRTRFSTMAVPVFRPPNWAGACLLAAAAAEVEPDSIPANHDLLADDKAVLEAVMFRGEGMSEHAETIVTHLARSAGTGVVDRLRGLLFVNSSRIRLPTPDLKGCKAADQEAAYAGDWDVWRLLVLVSHIVPGAFCPLSVPNFQVRSRPLLQLVHKWLSNAIPRAQTGSATPWQQGEWAVDRYSMLKPHQQSIMRDMEKLDETSPSKHFVVMDTGNGKTGAALAYMAKRAAALGLKYIIWVAPKKTLDSLELQFCNVWRAQAHRVPRISTAAKLNERSARSLELRPYQINLIDSDYLRTMPALFELAPQCGVVIDEVDTMYATTHRTSSAKRLAQLSAAFVVQTATPFNKTDAQIIAWLAMTDDCVVTRKNWLAAAASRIVIKNIDLGIVTEETSHTVPMTDEVRKQLLREVRPRNWLAAARTAQAAVDEKMVTLAVSEAARCRAKFRDSGALVVADNQAHAARIIGMLRDIRLQFAVGGLDTLEAPNCATYGIVVVTKDADRGYNAQRLGALITGAYASSAASRHQIRGRLRRIGQRFDKIIYHTVVLENSPLSLLHERQQGHDGANASLMALGEHFGAEILAQLTDARQ